MNESFSSVTLHPSSWHLASPVYHLIEKQNFPVLRCVLHSFKQHQSRLFSEHCGFYQFTLYALVEQSRPLAFEFCFHGCFDNRLWCHYAVSKFYQWFVGLENGLIAIMTAFAQYHFQNFQLVFSDCE